MVLCRPFFADRNASDEKKIQKTGGMTDMKNGFLTDEKGQAFMPLGLQAHNSSTGTELIQKAIHAVQLYGGNCLETPIYWYQIEPEMDQYCMELVRNTIDQVRAAGLKLILLWFGTSKNGHPNYVPEYIKLHPETYKLAVGTDGAVLPALSPHCRETLERDKKAFRKVMEFLKAYDEEQKTVVAVQIENEMGCGGTDRDYSELAEADYWKEIPDVLKDVQLEDSGCDRMSCEGKMSPWRKQFGRHAHEAFCAWYHAEYIGEIAAAGKEIYPVDLLTNVMVGESGYEEAGLCYNSGAAVGRVLDIWKAGAPALDFIGPDIYNQNRREYERICSRYDREDNPLFIPESPISDEANAMNAIIAAAKYGATGICCFGAESALDENGNLLETAESMALTIRTLRAIEPLLIKYRKTGRVHAIAEDEFETSHYLKLDHYHVIAHFLHSHPMYLGYMQDTKSEAGKQKTQVRGRGILVETDEHEFFLAGAGIALDFIKRPDPADEDSYRKLSSRYSGQLNFLSVEEGHFENGKWVTDCYRNGDETNYSQYVLEGQVIRIRLNPFTGM